MGVRLTTGQKEQTRRAIASTDPALLDFAGLAYAFEAANRTNKSTDLAEQYYQSLKAYHARLCTKLQIVKRQRKNVNRR